MRMYLRHRPKVSHLQETFGPTFRRGQDTRAEHCVLRPENSDGLSAVNIQSRASPFAGWLAGPSARKAMGPGDGGNHAVGSLFL